MGLEHRVRKKETSRAMEIEGRPNHITLEVQVEEKAKMKVAGRSNFEGCLSENLLL